MAANEFEFDLNGQKVYTGMQIPETYPLSFTPYPDEYVRSFDEIMATLEHPGKRSSRERWGPEKLINQGRRSSCNAYMAAAMWMRMHYLETGVWVNISPEFLYMHINGGRDQGSMLDDGMVFMTDKGMCLRYDDTGREIIPSGTYRKQDVNMEAMRYAIQDAPNQRAGECYRMSNRSPEKCWGGLLSCLAGRGQVGLAVHVGDRYMRSGKIAGFDNGPGNHAIAGDDIVTLNNNPRGIEDLGIVSPQSWGTNFADGGYTIITIKHIAQTYNVHALYGLRSTLNNPNEVSKTRIK